MDVKAVLLNWVLLFALFALFFLVWRAFSTLAGQHNKVKWLFGLLGIATLFIGTNVGTFIEITVEDIIMPGILRLPVGLLICWGLYKFLQSHWTNSGKNRQ